MQKNLSPDNINSDAIVIEIVPENL